VLPSAELSAHEGLESEIRRVQVGNQLVLVGRLESGQVVAFGTTCPHEMTDLEHATFVGGRVRCPRHNYLYDPETGANVIPTAVSRPESLWKLRPGYLPTWRTEEHDGWVWISKRPNGPPECWDPATEVRPDGNRDSAVASARAPRDQGPAAATPALVEHPVETLQVPLGGEFQVRLPAAPKPAYLWRVEVSTGLLTVVGQIFDPTSSPPELHVRVRADAPGEATLRCCYRRPWDVEPAEIRTYLVAVVGSEP
jgi:nitrite reductase/ring-hydroxylating ferredoxin subunit/predicted secreted protein